LISRKTNRTVWVLWACFVVRGLFYCMALPLWEGFDEYAHFGYVQFIALGRGWLVRPETRASREIERSFALVPMPWTLRADPPPHETDESYWRLPSEVRRERQQELASLPRSMGAEEAVTNVPVESQQPPLNYWLMAAVYRWVADLGLPARVAVLRILNLMLASVAVPAAWIAGRHLFGGSAGFATASAAVVALMPEMLFDAARVANSGLTTALYSVLAVLCLRMVEGKPGAAVWGGFVLGLGLLTKAFFLTAVPAVALLMAWAVWKRRIPARPALGGLGLAAALSGWWYLRILRVTGSLSGNIQDAALRHMPLAGRLRHIGEVNWLNALDSTFFSHIWFGGWSFLQLRAWIYHVFAILAVVAFLGLAVAWARQASARPHLAALASLYAFFCAGVAYHALMTFLVNGISSSAGWYLCALAVPEVILAAAGLRAMAPARVRNRAIGGVACAFALLDLYGMLFVALPYYAGLLGHKPGGAIEAFHWISLAQTGAGEILSRLAVNKPALFAAPVLAAGLCAYLAATGTLAALALTREARESEPRA